MQVERRAFLSAVAGFFAAPLATLMGKPLAAKCDCLDVTSENLAGTICGIDRGAREGDCSYTYWVEILPNGQYRTIDAILDSQGRLVKRRPQP